MRPSGSSEVLERRRLQAIAFLEDGLPPVEVAKKLGVDRRSVRRQKATFLKNGLSAIKSKPAPGRPARLTPKAKKQLEEHLFRGAKAAGFPTDLWTCPRIAQMIYFCFCIRYHVDHIGRLLRSLGWSPQRPQRRAKVSAIAVLCVSPGRDLVHLYFRLHPDANINGSSVLAFLKNLVFQLKRSPILLIWDRFLAHRARRVQFFILDSKTLHCEYLLAYAPELNPVENVWGYLKTNPLANSALFDVLTLAKTTRHHGRSLQRKSFLLRSFVKHPHLFLRLKQDIIYAGFNSSIRKTFTQEGKAREEPAFHRAIKVPTKPKLIAT